MTTAFQSDSFQNDGFQIDAGAGNNQSIAFTLDDVTVSVSQNLSHSQALAATLDDVAIAISQGLAGANTQALAITLDDVSVSIAQQGADLVRQGGLHKMRAQFRKTESEDQKRLRREAQGIIQRIKSAEPEEQQQLQAEAEDVSKALQDSIARLEIAAISYQADLAQSRELALMQRYQSMLIDAQLQAEAARQQMEEIDVAFVMFMLAAHI